MKQQFETRELITLDGSGIDMRGTYHKVPGQGDERGPELSTRGCVGIAFVNALSTPRSGYSDSAVYWAASFAAGGYPCFRFDLPGLGDSRGGTIPELLSFITDGGYASVITCKMRELVVRYDLAGIIVAGHCAGSVTALYAGADHKVCNGLILMDPYFNYPKRMAPRVPEKLVVWSRRTRLGFVARRTYDQVRELSRAVRKDGLPSSANVALIDQWKQVASRKIPTLVLTSPGLEPRAGQFDYLGHAVNAAGRGADLTIQSVADTDHSFANTTGKEAVKRHVREWLAQRFPISEVGREARLLSPARPAVNERRRAERVV